MLKVHRILLAEDELKLSKVIKTELIKKGYDIDLATNGIEAERLFNKNVYSLILLDINLPQKSGLDLCKEFRLGNKKIPIVMLTALGDIQDKVGAFNLGADDYIVKPFYFDELFARIKVFISIILICWFSTYCSFNNRR
jgi:DNA-binding response OmpR family regulator